MFAGAVRETVFSRPDVIRRISADFVPLATRAQLAANPGDRGGFDAERRLFGRIHRSRPAGQGICTLNSGGQVLDWVLTLKMRRA